MASPTTAPTPEQLESQLEALLNGPAGTPPPGVKPDFNYGPDPTLPVTLILAFCAGFATIAVIIRMYTKRFLIRSVASEDYALLLGWMSTIALAVPSALTAVDGDMVHMWNMQLKSFFNFLYWVNVVSIIYGPALFFIKLSILLQCLRIFVPNRKHSMAMFITVQICIWSNFVFYLVVTIFQIAMCQPREQIWNKLMTSGRCFNSEAIDLATGIFNVISDFAILILPMPCLWRLSMPLRKKVLTTIIFASGFLACVMSILRTIYSWKIIKSADKSYNIMIMGHWAYAEVSVGIVVGCLPIMHKFGQHFGRKICGSFSHKSESVQSWSAESSTKANHMSKFTRYLAERSSGTVAADTGNEPFNPKAGLKGKYVTIDEHERTPSN